MTLPVGRRFPALRHDLTQADVVAVSRATRELRPVHLEPEAARAAGLPDVILGTTGQQAWLQRAITSWLGTGAALRRLEIEMRAPVTPGALAITGEVLAVDDDGTVELAMTITLDGTPATTAHAVVAPG